MAIETAERTAAFDKGDGAFGAIMITEVSAGTLIIAIVIVTTLVLTATR